MLGNILCHVHTSSWKLCWVWMWPITNILSHSLVGIQSLQEIKGFSPPRAFSKKPHHTILGVLHPASSLHIVLWYLHFMEEKNQPKMPTQFLHYQGYTRKVPLLSSQPIPVHSWMNNVRINMSYSALFIISLDLMLSRGVKVWCLLNVIHFLSLCILQAKRAPSLLFCYCCFRVILKIREILKLFQVIS